MNSLPDDMYELWGEMVELTTERVIADDGFDYYPCAACGVKTHKSNMTYQQGVPYVCKRCAQERHQQWRQNHPERAKELSRKATRKRVARVNALPKTLTAQQWADCLQYWEYKCAVCGRLDGLWHVIGQDHWIPLDNPNCPGTIATNILPMCQGLDGCNNSKHSIDPETWLTRKLGKAKADKKLAEIQAYFEWVRTGK